MSQLVVDLNAGPRVLVAVRNMLNELITEKLADIEEEGELTAQEMLNGHKGGTENPAGSGGTTGPQTEGVTGTPAEGNISDGSDQVDTKGVIFVAQFCGVAAEPFYTSGKRKGQWKKRRGLTDAEYDKWYSKQPTTGASRGGTAGGQVNTGAAFGAEQKPVGPPVPKDCGSFMGWVAAKQAEGLITQEDVGDAYGKTGVMVTDLFPPNSEEVVAQHVAALYGQLVVKAGA